MAVIVFPNHTYKCGCKYKGINNTISYCKAHGDVIKTGESRNRAGQRNTYDASTPFSKPRVIQSKHYLARQVTDFLSHVEMEKFAAMREGDSQEWDRLTEIQSIALEQLKDEAGYQYQRIGRQTVEPWDNIDNAEDLWPQLRPDQLALQESIDVFLLRLTAKQQEVLRYRYWQMLSQKETAERLGNSKKTIEVDERNAKTSLIKKFREEWPTLENEEEVA